MFTRNLALRLLAGTAVALTLSSCASLEAYLEANLQPATTADSATASSGSAISENAGDWKTLMQVAKTTKEKGDPGMAMLVYQRAHSQAPDRKEPLVAMAELASEIGAPRGVQTAAFRP